MNYDLLTTICGIIVAVSGVVMLDSQSVFSNKTHVIAKCVNIAATSLGFYFANKTNVAKPKEVGTPADAVFADVKRAINELQP